MRDLVNKLKSAFYVGSLDNIVSEFSRTAARLDTFVVNQQKVEQELAEQLDTVAADRQRAVRIQTKLNELLA